MIKTQKRFVYEGFGFPVTFLNVPMIKVRGHWTPKVDYNKIAKGLLLTMVAHPARLTGSEIRFVRQYFKLTLKEFANRFAVSHPAVMKWEKSDSKPTSMAWGTEKDIRLFVLDQMGATAQKIGKAYRQLQEEVPAKYVPIKLDLAA